ncbi:MAG: dockerin type I domain-containing protein, partial [Pirellula sp.]
FESQGNKQLISMGSTTLLRRSASDGDVLLRIPSLDDWDSNPELVPIASGIASNAVIDSFGDRALILSQGVLDGSRITLLRYEDNSLEIEAQRDFESSVRVSSLSPVTRKLAIESTRGIEILSASTGLPTFLVLEQAVGPSVFDTSRGIFWSLSKSNTSRLVGWGIADGVKVFDVLFAQAGTSMLAVRTELSLGFRSDMLIGIRDGQIYRHSLSTAQGTVAQLADQVIQQVAIGVRSRGQSNPPILRSLPSMQAIEDTPAVIQTSDWVQATSDADGDSVHYIIVNAGEQGTVSWSTSSGGVYSPKPNANGQDRVVVQAYDGRGWSTPQTVSIQIQPVNDAPQGLLYSGVLAIPENQPGYVLGSLSIVDPDANEVFDYSVSDGRFEVVGNTLKVRDTAMIPYQNPGWIDLVLSARSRTNGDRIDRSERIFIVQDPTPFHNDINPGDVDGDGRITPLDPLIIINYINSNGSGQISPPGEGEAHNDLDVDGDGQVSPLDILLVINALNQANSEAEGEGAEAGGTSDPSTPQRAPIELDDPLGLKKPKR